MTPRQKLEGAVLALSVLALTDHHGWVAWLVLLLAVLTLLLVIHDALQDALTEAYRRGRCVADHPSSRKP